MLSILYVARDRDAFSHAGLPAVAGLRSHNHNPEKRSVSNAVATALHAVRRKLQSQADAPLDQRPRSRANWSYP